jgi:hypothetical protein
VITSIEAVIIGAAGVVVGAAVSGAAQIAVARSERRHDREERRQGAKRVVYESQLRLVTGLPNDMWNSITSMEQVSFQREVQRKLLDLKIGSLLDASPDVRHEMGKLEDQVRKWLSAFKTKYEAGALPEGESVTDIWGELFAHIVEPQLQKTADAMAADLGSRGE